jgi:hypothetical protein
MSRFASDRDRRVYERCLAGLPPHQVVGDLRHCQYDARVDLGGRDGMEGFVGAIVTARETGPVHVGYFTSARTLKAVWMDVVHAHSFCCLYAEESA